MHLELVDEISLYRHDYYLKRNLDCSKMNIVKIEPFEKIDLLRNKLG